MNLSKLIRRLCLYATVASTSVLGLWSPGNAAAAAGTAPDYKIRPGDLLQLTVFGEPTLSQPTLKVLPSGTIVEPLAGQIQVGGLTPPEAGQAVARALSQYVRHPQVAVAVTQVGALDVYVLGNVKLPGKYQLQPQSRVMDAIAAAGGLGFVDGPLPDARVSVGDTVRSVSLQRLLHEGDLSENEPLDNQMTVYVPSPITYNVEVFGAVDKPGDVQMHDGDRLVMAIARAGTSTAANADLNHVVVRHTNADGTVTSQNVNLYDIYKNGDSSKDVVLQKGDSVFVPQGIGRRDTVSPLTGVLYTLSHLFFL